MKIEFENLSFRYRGTKTPALDGITAAVGPGIHLLLGENGAGKTTLLHLIDGLRYPTSGKCLIDYGPTRYRLPSVLSKIFYLEAGMSLPGANIRQMTKIHAQFYPTFSQELLEQNLKDFEIDVSKPFSAMSFGMRQKAALAYALALQTPILLLDEPTTGLDIVSIRSLRHIMAKNISPEQTVIISTHHFGDLEQLYDSVMLLAKGKLLFAASTEDILSRLAFVGSQTELDNSLYSTKALSGWRSIIANDGSIESEIDYELLFLAMHEPESANNITNQLS